jgi:hypothetical protein
VERAYERAVHAILTGEQPASKALGDLESELERITGLHAGTEQPAAR